MTAVWGVPHLHERPVVNEDGLEANVLQVKVDQREVQRQELHGEGMEHVRVVARPTIFSCFLGYEYQ